MTPLLDTANRLTDESVRMVVNADRIFLNSQILTVLSSDPDTTLSSRLNTDEVTLLQATNKKKKYYEKLLVGYNAVRTLCVLEILKQLE